MAQVKINVSKQMHKSGLFSTIRMSKVVVKLMLDKVKRGSWTKTELLNMAREIIDENPLIYIVIKYNVKEDIQKELERLLKWLEKIEQKYIYSRYVEVPTYPPNRIYVIEEYTRYAVYSVYARRIKLRVYGLVAVGGKNPRVMLGSAPFNAPKLEIHEV